jgi:hypothetical protein
MEDPVVDSFGVYIKASLAIFGSLLAFLLY